jgi:hypothetical protein
MAEMLSDVWQTAALQPLGHLTARLQVYLTQTFTPKR